MVKNYPKNYNAVISITALSFYQEIIIIKKTQFNVSLWKSILKPEIRINIWINWVCGDICALFVKLRVKDDRRILKFIHTGRKLLGCVSLLLWNQTSQVDTHGYWASPWLFFICTFQNFLTFHYVAQTWTESSVNLALAYFLSPLSPTHLIPPRSNSFEWFERPTS